MENYIPPGSNIKIKKKAIDDYGRTVADVKIDGKNVSKLMKAKGWKAYQKKEKNK